MKYAVCHGCQNYKGLKTGVEYNEWKESHESECAINHHTSSSGTMEVNGMVKIFQRSVQRAGVRYGKYIGDGNAKTYGAIVKPKPYEDHLIPDNVSYT